MSSILSGLFGSTQNTAPALDEPANEPTGDLSIPPLVRQTAEPHITSSKVVEQPVVDSADSKKADVAKIDRAIELLSSLSGSTSERAIAGRSETYKYFPSVGQGVLETFIPLMNNDISIHNPTPPVGMSSVFYALQYCNISTDNDAHKLIMTDWVNDGFMTRLINAADSKAVLTPEARVQFLPGTYVHCKYQKINVLGSVFIREFKRWLTYVSRNDERWKRVIVFGDDDLSYTVYI